jgi:hypothetical protein
VRYIIAAGLGVAVAFVLGVGILLATGPTVCPKYAGLVQPSREFCVQPDPWTGQYLMPHDITFATEDGSVIPDPVLDIRNAVGLQSSLPIVVAIGVATAVLVAKRLPLRSVI